MTVDFLLTCNPIKNTPLANSRLFKRFQVLERLTVDDQEIAIKVTTTTGVINYHDMVAARLSLF